MNNTNLNIRNYNDLIAEKQRLKAHFAATKNNIKTEIAGFKDTLNPVSSVMKSIGKLTSPDKSMGILNTGLSFGTDFLIRKVLLKKSGWLVKLAAPFFIKNVLSHLAASKIKTNMPEMKPVIDSLTGAAKKS